MERSDETEEVHEEDEGVIDLCSDDEVQRGHERASPTSSDCDMYK